MDQASDDFVHALYDAVLDKEQWKVAIARLAALAEAPHAGLFDADFAAGTLHREVLFGIEEADSRRYMLEFASIDPRVPVALGNNKLEWLSDYDYFTEEFRSKDRFYREYLYAQGGGESLVATVAREGSRLGTAVLIRDAPQEKLGVVVRRRLDAVTPHIDRAVKLSRRFAAIASEAILGHTVLDALSEPLACVLADGRLHRVNLAFEEALKAAYVMSLKQGVLTLRDPVLQAQYLRAVRESCAIAEGETGGDLDASFTIRVDQLSGPPAFITVAPLAAVNLKSWAGRPCALVRVDGFKRKIDADKLVDALGLSAAEARLVAALCHGGTLASAAQRLGISINTAKSQIASVFSKTGTTRQSELLALVAALPRQW